MAYINSYKTYYENDRDMLRENNNKYREQNKEYEYEQITCGDDLCRHGLKRHQNTKTCK